MKKLWSLVCILSLVCAFVPAYGLAEELVESECNGEAIEAGVNEELVEEVADKDTSFENGEESEAIIEVQEPDGLGGVEDADAEEADETQESQATVETEDVVNAEEADETVENENGVELEETDETAELQSTSEPVELAEASELDSTVDDEEVTDNEVTDEELESAVADVELASVSVSETTHSWSFVDAEWTLEDVIYTVKGTWVCDSCGKTYTCSARAVMDGIDEDYGNYYVRAYLSDPDGGVVPCDYGPDLDHGGRKLVDTFHSLPDTPQVSWTKGSDGTYTVRAVWTCSDCGAVYVSSATAVKEETDKNGKTYYIAYLYDPTGAKWIFWKYADSDESGVTKTSFFYDPIIISTSSPQTDNGSSSEASDKVSDKVSENSSFSGASAQTGDTSALLSTLVIASFAFVVAGLSLRRRIKER